MSQVVLSKNDIYKVRILGTPNTMIIFCKCTDAVADTTIFGDIPNDMRVIYSAEQLYKDDNIHSIKKKIITELGIHSVAYPELYLFCRIPKKIDYTQLYSNDYVLSELETKQLYLNHNIDSTNYDEKSVEDAFQGKNVLKNVSVGAFYGDDVSYLFPINPLDMVSSDIGALNDDKHVVLMDNNLLLNYHYGQIHENTIYVCLANDVLDYGISLGCNEPYLLRTYYPILYKEGVHTQSDLFSKKQRLIQENETYINKNTLLYQKSVDIFYDIYYRRNGKDIPYLTKGITSFRLKIKSGFNALVPLESIFKTIHATKSMPFIKWNPGTRRENVYRLYTETRTNDGKHIPFLSENLVIKLSKEIGKSKQIATYIVDEAGRTFQMSIEQNGDVLLSSMFKSPIPIDELTQLMKTTINEVIQNINGYLTQVGYRIPVFDSFYSEDVEIITMNYALETQLKNELNFGKYIGCISSIFDVVEDNENTGTHMIFKRVENFREMDAQTRLITDMYKETDDIQDILNALMQNYKMSEAEANNRIVAYLTEHQGIRGKIVDNPGFSVFMKVSFFDKTLKIEVKDVVSIAYLETISIYLDTMIRLSQYPETVSIPKKELQSICTKVVKIDKDVLNPQIANIQTTAPVQPIQPIRFAKEVESDEDDDVDESKGIFYDEDEEEGLEGGYKGEGEDSSPEDKDVSYKLNPVGQSLVNPTLFFKRMKQLEPELFVGEESGKFQGYSRMCQSAKKRQPIILTKEEKMKIDKEHPNSYTEALKYGSDPNNPYYYICPRYWCLLSNTSMTEEDVIAGKCAKLGKPDKIIPANAKIVPKDAFVYEFNHHIQHFEKGSKEYHMGYPGFLKEKTPDGKLMPCCFKNPRKNWKYLEGENDVDEEEDTEDEDAHKRAKPKVKVPKKRATEPDVTGYIISNETFPMRQLHRFGFLPLVVQYFLQVDNNKCVSENNAAIIKPNTMCVLRSSVEQKPNQSIMGCFAELYANSQELKDTPSVQEFKAILQSNVSIDKFIAYNNGYLASIFKPRRIDLEKLDISKYEDSVFYKSIDLDNEYQMDFLEDTIAAYENFMDYIMNDKTEIDHTYLWDMMVEDNPLLIRGGVNLVILEITDNDITGNIKVLCPTNSRNKLYDPKKKTFILIKRDVFYEPLCIYKETGGNIYKTVLFLENATIEPIHRIMKIIEKSMNKYCMPNPSLPKIYRFKNNVSVNELYTKIKSMNERVLYQVLNYQYKTIGLVVGRHPIYLPCKPSAPIPDIEKHMIDDDRDDLWNDYYTTVSELRRFSSQGILSMPQMRVVDDGLVVGVITETNQFVQIDPPIENVAIQDGLPVTESSNHNIADKVITTNVDGEDAERTKVIKRISLESQFYSLFRTIVREALNDYASKNKKQDIMRMLENSKIDYKQKIKGVSNIIREIVGSKIAFDEFDDDVLMEFGDLVCSKESESPYCVVNEDSSTLVIPKRHLLTERDNEVIYYGRIADELLRYGRIRVFMMNDKNYLNITNTDYKMKDDEFILIQTSLNNDYLKNLVPMNISKQIKNTNFENAQPQVSQKYSTERIPLQEQLPEETTQIFEFDEGVISCINETVNVIGNPQQSLWKRIFPKTAKEIKFKNTSTNCSFYALIAAFQMEFQIHVSVTSVKVALWDAYKPYMEKYSKQILKLLKIQGKQAIVASIEANQMTLETAIMSPEYYISDLDIIVFAKDVKMQFCLFNSNGLRSLNKKNVQWYICGKDYTKKHYFIRSPTLTGSNKVGEYHLIDQGYFLNELGVFEKIVQDSVLGLCNDNPFCSPESIESLETLLSRN